MVVPNTSVIPSHNAFKETIGVFKLL